LFVCARLKRAVGDVDRFRQILAGLGLLAATLFTDVYAVRDVVWILRKVHLHDVEPWESGGILLVSPFLLYGAWRLILGRYTRRDTLSPGALGTLGVGFVGVGVFSFVYKTIFPRRFSDLLVSLGLGAIGLAWYRYGEAHPPTLPERHLESSRRMTRD
jgi:hypothetical protein